MAPLLGYIRPQDRTQEQADAHERAMTAMPRFTLTGTTATLAPGEAVILTQFFDNPTVVADIGFKFNGFRQLTGSCVGVSEGNAIAVLSAVQRTIATEPTKAFCPWWPFPYGRCRFNEGDHGQGEGAIDSVMVATLKNEGVFSITEVPGLPQFDTSDGLAISSRDELKWSDGGSSLVTACASVAKQHPLGTAAVVKNTDEMRDAIINGYPILDGCDDYMGGGSIQSGVSLGTYDGQGGHSTCYLGYWLHPTLGPLFLYSNQWAGSTYPDDRSGKPRCSTWSKEANVSKLFRLGGTGETFALSHQSYFPAQPEVLNWLI